MLSGRVQESSGGGPWGRGCGGAGGKVGLDDPGALSQP